MAARRYDKKKQRGNPPTNPPGKIEPVPEKIVALSWDQISAHTRGDFFDGMRGTTPAGDVISNLNELSQSVSTTSPAVSLSLSQLQAQSDFQPEFRLKYDTFWKRWRKQVIEDYNSLGAKIPQSAKIQALANTWAQGMVQMSHLLRNQSDPNKPFKNFSPSMEKTIREDFGSLDNFVGYDHLGSPDIWDDLASAWWDIVWKVSSIKDAFWETVNYLRVYVGGNIEQVWNWLSSIWNQLAQLVDELWNAIGKHVEKVWARIQGFSDSVFPKLGDWLSSLRSHLGTSLGKIEHVIDNAIESFTANLLPTITALSASMLSGLNTLRSSLNTRMDSLRQSVFNAAFDIWNHITQTQLQVPSLTWNTIVSSSGGIGDKILAGLSGNPLATWANARAALSDYTTSAYDSIANYLKQQAPITPEKVPAIAAGAVGLATSFGLAAHLSSSFFELAHPLKRIGLHQISAFLSDMGSFSSIAAATGGVMAATAIRQPFQYYANDLFRPRIPGDFFLQEMAVKPDINMEDFKKYMAWYGFSDFWIDRIQTTMFKEPRHFELGIMMEDSSAELPWLFTKCRRAGYSPDDSDILSDGLIKKTERTQRQDLYREAYKLYKEGYITSQEFDRAISPLELRESTHEIAKQAADMSYIYDHTTEMVSLLTDEYIKEVIDESDLVVGLVALGITPEKVDFLVAKAQIRKLPKPRNTEEAQLKAAIAQLQKKYIALYTEQFRKEVIQADEFLQNLKQIGLTPEMASVTVQMEITRRLKVPSTEIAKTVSQAEKEMTALYDRLYREQYRKGQIDKDTLFKNLFALGYSQQKVSTLVSLEDIRMYEPPNIEAV